MVSNKARTKKGLGDKTVNLVKAATKVAAEAMERLQTLQTKIDTQEQSLNDMNEQKRLLTEAVTNATIESTEDDGQDLERFLELLLQQGVRLMKHDAADPDDDEGEGEDEQDVNNTKDDGFADGFVVPPRRKKQAPEGMRYEWMHGCRKCPDIVCDRVFTKSELNAPRSLEHHIKAAHPGEKMKDLYVEKESRLRKA